MVYPIFTGVDRRRFMKGLAGGAGLTALASTVGYSRTALGAENGMVGSQCMTIVYENGPDVRFDYDYYRDNHLTLIMDRYAGAIERFELRRPLPMEGTPAPPYAAAVNIWISDPEAFAAAGAEHGEEVAADVENFTNASLVAQMDTVWGEAGAGLHAPVIGQDCMTILYPWEDGATWDADYYRDGHMPLIMDLYGREAIRRFEVRKGPEPSNGNPPAFLGTVNIYIEDQEAFDAAGREHTQALVDDVPNFSSVMPLAMVTEVYGIGE